MISLCGLPTSTRITSGEMYLITLGTPICIGLFNIVLMAGFGRWGDYLAAQDIHSGAVKVTSANEDRFSGIIEFANTIFISSLTLSDSPR